VSMRAIPVSDQIIFLAGLSKQIAGVGDGVEVTMKVVLKPQGH